MIFPSTLSSATGSPEGDIWKTNPDLMNDDDVGVIHVIHSLRATGSSLLL